MYPEKVETVKEIIVNLAHDIHATRSDDQLKSRRRSIPVEQFLKKDGATKSVRDPIPPVAQTLMLCFRILCNLNSAIICYSAVRRRKMSKFVLSIQSIRYRFTVQVG